MTNRQSCGAFSMEPTISMATFCHGRSGRGTGCSGVTSVLALLSAFCQTKQLWMASSTCLSIPGHQNRSRSRALVRYVPGCASCAVEITCGVRDGGTARHSPRESKLSTTDSSSRTAKMAAVHPRWSCGEAKMMRHKPLLVPR